MTRYQRERQKLKKAAGRMGGLRSQEVQREKRQQIDRQIFPVTPRWSFAFRDNWTNEVAWCVFRSEADMLRRIKTIRMGLTAA